MIKSLCVAFLLLLTALLILACGGKKMSDEAFVAVATTVYEDVKAGWDQQPGEAWKTYLGRRIAQACTQHGFEVSQWDKKMREVQKQPEEWEDKLDPAALAELLKWQDERRPGTGQ